MKTQLFRHIASVCLASACLLQIEAQTLSESVTVEGRFTPRSIPADRLPLLPSVVTITAPQSTMSYDRDAVAADFAPDALSMPTLGWRQSKNYDNSRGFVDLSLGSWLNSSLSAGYSVLRTRQTNLNLWLQHNSSSLWEAWKKDADHSASAARRFRYDETIGLDFRQKVDDAGSLSALFRYHLGYFNYYATRRVVEEGHYLAPSQTLNDVAASIAWTGLSGKPFHYSANAGLRHFAFRSMYVPTYLASNAHAFSRSKGERETLLDFDGKARYAVSGEGSVDLALKYSGVFNAIGPDVNRVEMIPAYSLARKNFNLRVGANLAIVGTQSATRFRIAPDVAASFRKALTAVSVSIGGGTHLRTMAWRHNMNYYDDPAAGCYGAAYSPVDVRAALQLNPGGKWTVGVEAGWISTLDEAAGGMYQLVLDAAEYPEDNAVSGRLHGMHLSLNAAYRVCRFFSLNARGSWQPQHGNTGILNGFDRPAITADISATSNPTDRLSLDLTYRLRAKRLLAPGNISRLDLQADYLISDKISVGAELNNLLNRHEQLLPQLPVEGFNAAARVQIVF